MQLALKRLIDVTAAATGIVLLSPVLLACAVLVRLSMGGAVLFRQMRPGLRERPFTMLKFRTMSDERDAAGDLLPDAQRITCVGGFLRSTSLDEVPELFNVLKGDMSLVGPRPLLMRYLPYFSDEERLRFTVRPGVTGLAQISGRNDLPWDERLHLDVTYVQDWSLWLDVRIIVLTFLKVVFRQGVQIDPHSTMLDFDEERRQRVAQH
jgi:sugar transferase EpsL